MTNKKRTVESSISIAASVFQILSIMILKLGHDTAARLLNLL